MTSKIKTGKTIKNMIPKKDIDVQHIKEDLLLRISNDYKINYNELFDKYISSTKITRPNNEANKVKDNIVPRKSFELIKTCKFIHNDIEYLIDDNNNIYTNNIEKPKVVGLRLIDKSIKFFDN